MKKLTLLIISFLSLHSFSSLISENVKSCSSSSISELYDSLENLENYHKIDKDGYKIGPFVALDMTQSTPIKDHPGIYLIALRPVPNHVSSLKSSQYPHFFMKCQRSELSNEGFTFNCQQLVKQKKFTVENLKIDINFSNNLKNCPNKVGIEIDYQLEINDKQYDNLKTLIKSDLSKKYPKALVDLIIDRMINSENFFKGYWRNFFNKWLEIR